MIVSDINFDSRIRTDSPTLVMFWQRDCQPCKALVPELIDAAKERKTIDFILMNAADNPKTKAGLDIRVCPTMVIFAHGALLGRYLGAVPKEKILAWIDRTVANVGT